MEIVVSDTQILIDMDAAGLLEMVSASSMHFHTVDYVLAELHRSPHERPLIDRMVASGALKVYSFEGKQNADLYAYYGRFATKTNLSITDCAVLKYARDNGYRMLTGDRKLRNHAEDEGVMVSGIIYLAERFVEEKLISGHDMAVRIQHLLNVNPRLPKAIFQEWLKAYI